jgi:hypothetical protein
LPRFLFLPLDVDWASADASVTGVEKARSTSHIDKSTSLPPYAKVSEEGDSSHERSRIGRAALSTLEALD